MFDTANYYFNMREIRARWKKYVLHCSLAECVVSAKACESGFLCQKVGQIYLAQENLKICFPIFKYAQNARTNQIT
jgi:hypothetical protein